MRSVTELLMRYRRNEVSCKEVVANCLAQIGERGLRDGLNCIAALDETIDEQIELLNQADNCKALPLYGVPLLIKDNINVAGMHTTAGSLALADVVAAQDADVVTHLRRNGALILGKTNLTEFANFVANDMPGGYSSLGGQVLHAIDPRLNPSGSSSGSGVAVSAGLVPAAIGTDTSFSVIACARANGICGLKPPHGALSAKGIVPLARTLDSAGPMTHSIADALLLYSCMRERPYAPPSPAEGSELRIAVNLAGQEDTPSRQKAFVREAIAHLKGHHMAFEEVVDEPTRLPIELMKWEFRPQLEEYLAASNASLKTFREIVDYYESHPETMMKYGDALLRACLDETSGNLRDPAYLGLLETRAAAIREKTRLLSKYDAVFMAGSTNTMHLCGFPSVTLKTPIESGTKGLMGCLILYGVDESRLYRAALAMEHAFAG